MTLEKRILIAKRVQEELNFKGNIDDNVIIKKFPNSNSLHLWIENRDLEFELAIGGEYSECTAHSFSIINPTFDKVKRTVDFLENISIS